MYPRARFYVGDCFALGDKAEVLSIARLNRDIIIIVSINLLYTPKCIGNRDRYGEKRGFWA